MSTFVEDKTDVGFEHTFAHASPIDLVEPAPCDAELALRRAAARRLVVGMLGETGSFVMVATVVHDSPDYLDALDHFMGVEPRAGRPCVLDETIEWIRSRSRR